MISVARAATIRAVVFLGLPIVVANLLTWSVGFADVLMVSRLGESANRRSPVSAWRIRSTSWSSSSSSP